MANMDERRPADVEAAIAELERIVGEIEGGRLGLEDGLDRYERGNYLIQHCRRVLAGAEERLERLAGERQPGEP